MGGCVIRLWPDEEVTQGLVLGEGVETVLAAATTIVHRGTLLGPAWAAGSAGNLESFPVLRGIESLTILTDNDVSGRGQQAAHRCGRRWREAGRYVALLVPRRAGTDFNDIIRENVVVVMPREFPDAFDDIEPDPAESDEVHASKANGNCSDTKAATSLDDFYAYMPMHCYIYAPTREMWPAASINAKIEPIEIIGPGGLPLLNKNGEPKTMPASMWLDRNQPVEQLTWSPGLPMLIKDRLVSDGGWIERKGVTCYNLYRPPLIVPGNAAKANRWLDHVHRVFGDDAAHIIKWCAHRVQRPQEKINHAIVLGGKSGHR